MNKKLVITAISSVSSLGIGYDKVAEGLKADKNITNVKSYDFHELDREVPAYKVSNFEPKEILGKKGLRTMDHSTKLLLAAMELGMKEILDAEDEDNKPGIVAGTSFGSVQSIGDFLSDSIENGVGAVNPMLFANTVINSPIGQANIRYGVKTLSTTVCDGFNSSLDAIIYSCDFIKSGYMPALITGGVEEVSYYELLGFERSGSLSKGDSAKPFAKDADGIVAGEGSAVFLIETEDSAAAHGRTAIAEIVGYASAFDPYDGKLGFNPEGEGAKYVLKEALKNAELSASDIDFIASSANGDLAGDTMEAAAIKEVFGDTPVTAYKAKLGECYGASSALALACTISDMENKCLTGTGESYDAVEGINLVTETISDKKSEYAAITSFGCDGNCGAVIIKKR